MDLLLDTYVRNRVTRTPAPQLTLDFTDSTPSAINAALFRFVLQNGPTHLISMLVITNAFSALSDGMNTDW